MAGRVLDEDVTGSSYAGRLRDCDLLEAAARNAPISGCGASGVDEV